LIVFGIIVLLSGLGLAFVGMTLFKDSKGPQFESSVEKIKPEELKDALANKSLDVSDNIVSDNIKEADPEEKPIADKPSLLTGIVGKVKNKLNINTDDISVPEPTPMPGLKEHLEKVRRERESQHGSSSPQTGTKSVTTGAIHATPNPQTQAVDPTSPAAETTHSITPVENQDLKQDLNKEINASVELTELKEKYERLDKLFKEKSSELDNVKQTLESEQKNRKDFNKVKDLLEKELSDTKDRVRKIGLELTNNQAESESLKKQITQLEDKAANLENQLTKTQSTVQPVKPGPKSAVESSQKEEPVLALKPIEDPGIVLEPAETPEAPVDPMTENPPLTLLPDPVNENPANETNNEETPENPEENTKE